MADFGMIQTPDFARAALGGYQAGQAIGKQRRLDAALATYANDPDAGIKAADAIDPALSATLQANHDRSVERDAWKQYTAASTSVGTAPALTNAAPQIVPAALGSQPSAPIAPPAHLPSSGAIVNGSGGSTPPAAAPVPRPAAAAVANASDEITVNHDALVRYAMTSPAAMENAKHIFEFSKTASDAQKKAFLDGQEALGIAWESSVGKLPYEQRRAAIQRIAPQLMQHGVSAEAINNFDPTDENGALLVGNALGMKGIFERQDKNRAADREDAKFIVSRADKAADNARADAQLVEARRGHDLAHNDRVASAVGAADPLDATSITYVADQYRKTGQMPPLGMGKQAAAMRAAIIGEAARRDQAEGVSGADAAVNHADYHANKTALATISRTNSNILAFEDTANRNADYVLSTAKKGAGTTGVPLFNKWQQAGRRSINGDPDVSRFDVAVKTFANEYAKVTSGASGGAVTSDSARHEIDSLINGAQTPTQLEAVISQAKIEMGNRRAALNDQRTALRDQLRGHVDAPTDRPAARMTRPPASTSGAKRIAGNDDYARLPSGALFVGPDGQTRRKP